jgi:hypothetical protein
MKKIKYQVVNGSPYAFHVVKVQNSLFFEETEDSQLSTRRKGFRQSDSWRYETLGIAGYYPVQIRWN